MSQTIDTKVVEMKFDNSDFEKNVKTSMSTLDRLKESLDLDESAKSFEKVSKAAGDVSFEGLNSGLETLKGHFSALEVVATAALWNITQKAIDAGLQMAKSLSIDLVTDGFSQYESKTQSVQTIMNATGKDINTVNNALEKLIWFADETSYSFSDMVDNVGKFTAAGVDLDTAVNAMMGISNWAAVSGQNPAAASRAMYNLSQAMGLGAVTTQDWKSIELANMATAEFKQTVIETAEQLGKISPGQITLENFRSTLRDQWFDNDVLLAVLGRYSEYTDMVYDRVLETGELCAEAMDGVSAQMGDSFDKIGEKAFKAAQEAKTFTDAINAVKDAVKSQWGTLFEGVFGNYEEAKVTFTNLANTLWDVFAGPLADFNQVVQDTMKPEEITQQDLYGHIFPELRNELGLTAEQLEGFKTVLIETAKQNGIAVDEMIEAWGGSFGESLNEGWLTTEVFQQAIDFMKDGTAFEGMTEAVSGLGEVVDQVINGDFGSGEERYQKLTEAGWDFYEVQEAVDKVLRGEALSFDDLSDAQLRSMGLTDDQIEGFRLIGQWADQAGNDVNALYTYMESRQLRNETWNNLIDSLGTYTEAFRTAFSNVFGSIDTGDVRAFLERIHGFSESLLDEDRVARFQQRIQNVFSLIKSILNVLKGVWSVVKAILGNTVGPVLKGLVNILTTLADNIGNLFGDLQTATESMTFFGDAVDWINNKLAPFKRVVEVVSDAIVNFINALFQGRSFWSSLVVSISGAITALGGVEKALKFKKWMTNLKNLGKTFGDTFKNIGSTLSEAWEIFQNTDLGRYLSDLVGRVGTALSNAWKAVSNWFKNLFKGGNSDFNFLESFKNALDSFNNWLSKLDLETNINKVSDAVMGFKDSIKNRFESIRSYLEKNEIFGKVKDTVTEKFSDLREAIKSGDNENEGEPFITRVLNGIKTAVEWFKDNMPSLDQVIHFITGILGGGTLLSLIGLIRTIKNLFSGGSGLIRNFNKILSGAANALNAFAFSTMTEGLYTAAKAIGVLTIALIGLSFIDSEKLRAASEALLLVSVGIAALVAAFAKLNSSKAMLADANKKEASPKAGLEYLLTSVGKGLETLGTGAAQYLKYKGIGAMLIGVAAALAVMAAAVYALSKLNLQELAQGVGAVIVLVMTLAGAMKIMTSGTSSSFSVSKSGISGSRSGGMGSAFAFVGMAAAILLFVKAIDEIRQYKLDELIKGVSTVGVLLLELSLAVRISGNNMNVGTGLGMLTMGLTVMMFVKSIAKIRDYNMSDILKGVLTLGAILGEIAIFTRIVKDFKASTAASIILLAGALLIFIKALKEIAEIPSSQLGSGLGGLVITLTSLAGFIWVIDKVTNSTKSLALVLAGIGAIILGVAAAIWAVSYAINKGINLNEVGSQLGGFISGLITSLVEAIVNSADSIIGGVISLLETLSTYVPQLVDILVDLVVNILDALTLRLPELATSIANFCKGLIDAFAVAFSDVDVSSLVTAINEVLLATLALTVIGKFGSIIGITKAIVMMAEVIGAFGLIIAAFGALSLIPGFNDFMNGGVEVLITIANGIGGFFGALVGAFVGEMVESFSNSLPTLATNLSTFMTNLGPFIENGSNIDSNFVSSVRNLVTAMLMIAGGTFVNTIVNAIDSFFFGGVSGTDNYIAKFAVLGEGIAAFAESIKDIDQGAVNCATNAAQAITALINVMPADGGIWQKLFGTKNFESIDEDLGKLGSGVAKFCTALTGVTVSSDTATSAATAISTLINVMPLQNGLWQDIVGNVDFTNVDTDFGKLGTGVANFCSALTGITIDSGTATSAADAISKIINIIPPSNGLWQKIVGNVDFTDIDLKFSRLGAGVAGFCKNLEGVTIDGGTAESAASVIGKLINVMPLENGLWQEITGTKNFTNIDLKFGKLGSGVAAFCTAINEVTISSTTTEAATAAAAVITILGDCAPKTGGLWQDIVGEVNLGELGNNMGTLGEGIAAFMDSTKSVTRSSVTRGKIAAQGIIDILGLQWPMQNGSVGDFFDSIFGGSTSWTDIKTDAEDMADMIKSFTDSIGGISAEDTTAAYTVAETIVKMFNLEWPTTDGSVGSWFKGLFGGEKINVDEITQNIIDVGAVIKFLTEQAEGLSENNSTANAQIMFDLINSVMTSMNGMIADGGTTQGLSDVREAIVDIGKALTSFSESMGKINFITIGLAGKSIKALVGVIETMSDTDFDKATGFSDALNNLAETGIKDFCQTFVDSETKAKKVAMDMIAAVIKVIKDSNTFKSAGEYDTVAFSVGLASRDTELNTATTHIKNTVNNALKDYTTFSNSGKSAIGAYKDGINANSTIPVSAAQAIATAVGNALAISATMYSHGKTAIENFRDGMNAIGSHITLSPSVAAGKIAKSAANEANKYGSFYDSGENDIKGLVKGLNDNAWRVYAALRDIANEGNRVYNETSDQHSPSKVYYQSGKNDVLGLAYGIIDNSYMVEQASADMANNSIETVKTILSNTNFEGIDNAPVIRPVLDLSEIQNGADRIDGMLMTDTTLGVDTLDARNLAGNIDRMLSFGSAWHYDDTDVIATINSLGQRIDALDESILNMQIYLNGTALVGGIAKDMDAALGSLANKRKKGVM